MRRQLRRLKMRITSFISWKARGIKAKAVNFWYDHWYWPRHPDIKLMDVEQTKLARLVNEILDEIKAEEKQLKP